MQPLSHSLQRAIQELLAEQAIDPADEAYVRFLRELAKTLPVAAASNP